MRPALLWVITQPVVVITFRRFGTTYLFHLERSRILEPEDETGYPETSVRNYNYSLRNNPKERSFHCGEWKMETNTQYCYTETDN